MFRSCRFRVRASNIYPCSPSLLFPIPLTALHINTVRFASDFGFAIASTLDYIRARPSSNVLQRVAFGSLVRHTGVQQAIHSYQCSAELAMWSGVEFDGLRAENDGA